VLLDTERLLVVDSPEARLDTRAVVEALGLAHGDLVPLDDLEAECTGLRVFARSPVVRDSK